MSKRDIKLSQTRLSDTTSKYLEKLLRANQNGEDYPVVQDFEAKICEYIGVPYGCALISGTAALHLGFQVLGVQKGDTVLCSSFTFAASAFPITYLAAKPIFIDVEIGTWNLCPVLLEQAITSEISKGQKPKAIVVVHSYGVPAQMDAIVQVSKKYQIPVLEDAAEALGATYNGKPVGAFGDLAVFSFNANKVVSTLGGGMLVGKNRTLLDKAKYLATQAKLDTPHYEHTEIGYNYSMSPLAAAVGMAQLELLQSEIQKRKAVFEYYQNELKNYKEIQFLDGNKTTVSNGWLTCIQTPSFAFREQLRLRLKKEGIESRPLWKPMHQQPVFANETAYVNGNSDALFEKGLCLPSSAHLSEQELKRVIGCVKNN